MTAQGEKMTPIHLSDPVRGEFTLTERDELALRAAALGYRWIAPEPDKLRLLFLGLVDQNAALTEAGRAALKDHPR